MPNVEFKNKHTRIKIVRILLSLLLPTLSGIVIYSIVTNIYKESLFWLAVLFSIHSIFLLMFLPSLVFTIIMEWLGIRLLQRQGQKIRVSNIMIYLACGTLFGIFYSIIAELNAPAWILFISAFTCFMVSFVKMALHIRERKYKYIPRAKSPHASTQTPAEDY